MKKLFILSILIVVFCSGCFSTAFLPTRPGRVYPPTKSVKIYWQGEEPGVPYEKIGLVIADTSYLGEKDLFEKLIEKAEKIGADGLMMKEASTERGWALIGPFATKKRLSGIAIRLKRD